LDKLDYLILKELLGDATISLVTVAKRVGTSPFTVRRRYEKLKKDGIIHRSIVSIDLAKLGYQGKAFLFITVGSDAKRSETISYLKTIRNIIVVTELIGPYDLLAIAPVRDLKNIQILVKETRKAPGVQQIKLACVNNTDFPIGKNYSTILSEKSRPN
jgi:Lrp/AsnC family transcriptional regulator, regulator for asnA, asnC and gidA